MDTRKKALAWWQGLSNQQQRFMHDHVEKSSIPFVAFAAYSSKIEALFRKTFNIKPNAPRQTAERSGASLHADVGAQP